MAPPQRRSRARFAACATIIAISGTPCYSYAFTQLSIPTRSAKIDYLHHRQPQLSYSPQLKLDRQQATYNSHQHYQATTRTRLSSSSSDQIYPMYKDNDDDGNEGYNKFDSGSNKPHKLSSDSANTTSSRRSRSFAFAWQFIASLAIYAFHTAFLTSRQIVLPFQLIPNSQGHFAAIGLDSLAGMSTLIFYFIYQRRNKRQGNTQSSHTPSTIKSSVQTYKRSSSSLVSRIAKRLSSPLISTPQSQSTQSSTTTPSSPWQLPSDNVRQRLTSLIAGMLLVQAYFWTGRFSLFWEDLLYTMSGLGWPITLSMHRSLCVLLGHLSWVTIGVLVLRWIPRPPRFFGNKPSGDQTDDTSLHTIEDSTNNDHDTNGDDRKRRKSTDTKSNRWKWFTCNRSDIWIWWTMGGYFVTSMVFDIADVANQYLLPAAVLESAQESVVSQLVSPEYSDFLASAVGYIAPCLTAPWWEEILYRGFLLSTLTQALGYKWAVFVQGVVFSAHHMSLAAAIPLAVLGWTWAHLYKLSGNLFTVIFIHALWNSRVFLGSWLGL
jgi:membrane protease YdiL (CAAX protease family)